MPGTAITNHPYGFYRFTTTSRNPCVQDVLYLFQRREGNIWGKNGKRNYFPRSRAACTGVPPGEGRRSICRGGSSSRRRGDLRRGRGRGREGWKITGALGPRLSTLRCLYYDCIYSLPGCLCPVMPLPCERHWGWWGGEGRGSRSPSLALPFWSQVHSSPGLTIWDSGQITVGLRGPPPPTTEWVRLEDA